VRYDIYMSLGVKGKLIVILIDNLETGCLCSLQINKIPNINSI
jgi:TPP-dependent trihydroxycyclohexane-1,2-dione (THcHDO) dehydratase